MESKVPSADDLRRRFPELRLLVLYGSRARGEAHAGSDWDFAYVSDAGFDELGLRADLSSALASDEVDLADLDRAGGVLRYAVARDGKALFERSEGEFERFALSAIRFWLDVEPVIRESQQAMLERLG